MRALLWTRRRWLQTLAVAPYLAASGCQVTKRLPAFGEIIGANLQRGHRLRHENRTPQQPETWNQTSVLIVGGGVAGLSALRELSRCGIDDCVLLELEDHVGGTARGGSCAITGYPWGAHYLPAPFADNQPLVQLLDEMGIVQHFDDQGEPVYREEHLCRDPEERLFADGIWSEDLRPGNLSADDEAEWMRFQNEIDQWVAWRDPMGRRAFVIPADQSSSDEHVLALDRISMDDWLTQHQFRSPLVRWEVDYACRDDYGCRPDTTSAWAGLFYFASRKKSSSEHSQPFLTWPEGNARITNFLFEQHRQRIHTGALVTSITPRDSHAEVLVQTQDTDRVEGWRASRVIFAAPQFVAPYVIAGYSEARKNSVHQFTYSPWLVANLHLKSRPQSIGFPFAWDNVLRDSPGLGYVVATHQSGRDYGPTVFTYYRALCDEAPRDARESLQQLSWESAAEMVLADLETAHPDLRGLVERLDVMKWGHAMIRPTPGFRSGEARRICRQPFANIHFAHSDLSGLALFEEAFEQGRRAASEVAAAIPRAPT